MVKEVCDAIASSDKHPEGKKLQNEDGGPSVWSNQRRSL